MYTLALDTTGYKIHLSLFKNDTLVFERDWRSNMNEDETITKTLQHLLDLEPFYTQKLTKIIVNEGPGTLTGTRVGVSMMNALSFASKCPIVKTSTPEVWSLRLRDEDKALKPHQLLRVTEQDLLVDGKLVLLVDLLKLLKKEKKEYLCYGELTPTQYTKLNEMKKFTWIIEPDLLPFTKAILGLSDKGNMKKATVKYAKEPVITESKKEVLIPLKKVVVKAEKKEVKKAVKIVKKPAKKLVKKVAKPVKKMIKKAVKKPVKTVAKKSVKVIKKPVKKFAKLVKFFKGKKKSKK